MFDVGFWELGLIALIGLIVLGPERLPKVARSLGLWAGKARRYVGSFTADLEREANLGDIRREFTSARDQFSKQRDDIESSVSQFRDDLDQSVNGPGAGRDHFRRARSNIRSRPAPGSDVGESPASSASGDDDSKS